MKWWLPVAATAMIVGCENDEYFQKLTAPMTNCNVPNLQITDIKRDKPSTWRAICRSDGRIFQCTKKGCTEVK
jgi:hypothetical protein